MRFTSKVEPCAGSLLNSSLLLGGGRSPSRQGARLVWSHHPAARASPAGHVLQQDPQGSHPRLGETTQAREEGDLSIQCQHNGTFL